MSSDSEHDGRADHKARSGFIDEGRRRDERLSNGQPRKFICMGIVREEWDIQTGRKRAFS